MKPLSVKQIRTVLAGDLIQGSDETIVHYGAYRLKQILNKNTIFFLKKKIVNWEPLKKFFPLIIVTHRELNVPEQMDGLTVIKVKNTEDAYWKFIHYYRRLFQIPVVAITGTSGKTTTKEMISHILTPDKIVTATNITSNSRTAHFQYLLNINENTEAAIFETAVGAPGDIINAGKYFKPTIGIITNIGAHHLNYCKSPEAYIKAKAEMLEILNQSGVLIINAEDKNTKKIDLSNFRGRIIKVGTDSSSQFQAKDIKYKNNGMQFTMHHKSEQYIVFVPGLGEHQVYNALAAIAAAYEIGVPLLSAINRIKTFQNLKHHLQAFKGWNGSTILDDTWSITTTSLEAGLKVLSNIGKGKKRVAIIGTLTDLGSWGYIIHKQAGGIICQVGVDILITIGQHASIMADQVLKKNVNVQVYTFNNSPLVYDLLAKILDENTIVLIKGDMYSKPIIELAKRLRTEQ